MHLQKFRKVFFFVSKKLKYVRLYILPKNYNKIEEFCSNIEIVSKKEFLSCYFDIKIFNTQN